ncbi:CD177 antigen-like [Mustelus asterias]
MKLFLSVVFLYTGIAEVRCLKCYSCAGVGTTCNDQQQTCPAGVNNCLTAISTVNVGGIVNNSFVKGCYGCPGEFSMNFGLVQTSGKCCSSDLCNNQQSYDKNEQPNGLTCYGEMYGLNPSTVKCSGIQDRCLKFTIKAGDTSIEVKGCGSKNLCQMSDTSTIGMEIYSAINCCENGLCNKGTKLPGSWILLFIPLILVAPSFL